MRRRSGKVSSGVLVALCAVALLFAFLEGRSLRSRRSRMYDVKLASARLAQRAFAVLQGHAQAAGVPVDSVNDPNLTGLVGVQSSQLTFGRSDISDALTSANPDFCAVVLEMLDRAGVRPGDTIGVSWDGTYPALNVQVLAVAATFGVEPVIVSAQSSGSWGANYPGFSWLELERRLREDGVLGYSTRLATLGGDDDAGRGLTPEGRTLLATAAESAGVELFVPATLQQGVARRMELFARCRALVVVGRPAADIGEAAPPPASRLYLRRARALADAGLMARMLERRVPVAYLGNPGRVALDYRLPVAPVPLPEPGRSRLFTERRYSVPLAAGLAAVLLALLLVVVRYDVETWLGLRRQDPAEEEAV